MQQYKNPLVAAEFFIEMKKFDEAKIILDLLKPYTGEELTSIDAIGKLYAEVRDFNTTLELAKKTYAKVKTDEERYILRVNMIRAYLNLNKPEEALELVLENEKIKPSDHPNMMDKAMALFLLNRKTEGEQLLRSILTQPRSKDIDSRVRFNLGTYDIANGNFKEGLRHVLLDGKLLNIWQTYALKNKRWRGEVVPGQTVVMCFEGGIGDELINIRFQKHIRDLGMKPLWYTDRKDLAEIYRRNGYDVIETLDEIDPDWLWTYSMETPTWLDIDYTELWYGPYLTPKRDKDLLPGKFKVGIKHSGNPKYDQDLNRTLPLDQMLDAIPEDWTIYSFHIDEDINHPRVTPLRDKIKSWDDTLDYLDQMDLVVSSCTSLPHAAAAMGKETIVCTPILNYYTWAYNKSNKSAWYGDVVTILRQSEYNNWNSTMAELKELLHEKNLQHSQH
jgi:tetratricopeptide (TPR) repeat protein